ncbi:SLC13 family permease [Caenispirillum bisanense]|uniref:SLC13 family permease n=1 Tax=Caenispirillum bisanense TaxID=414052 RepID=UPI0031DA14A7
MDLAAHAPALFVFAVVVVIFIGFIREWTSADILAMTGAGVLMVAGLFFPERLITPDEMFQVFSNSGPITVGAMFVLSAAMQRTGVIAQLAALVTALARRSKVLAVPVLLVGVMGVSAFVNNTPVVVVLTPVVIALARSIGRAPSQLLMPLSYAAIMGGMCTLIGTSTNLLVAATAERRGMEAFHIFEISLPGMVMGAAGVLYMMLIGRRLLPDRPAFGDLLDTRAGRRFITELLILRSSELAGKPLEAIMGPDTEIVDLIRNGVPVRPADKETELKPGDRIIVLTTAAEAVGLRQSASERDEDDQPAERPNATERARIAMSGLETVRQQETTIREGIVGPNSRISGRLVGSLNLRRLFDVRILAVHRHGGDILSNFDRLRLETGDTLLLEGPPEGLKRLFDARDLVNLSEPELRRRRTERAPIAVLAIAAVVLLAAFNVMPIHAAALLGAVVVVVTGCVSAEEAYEAIDWRILFLIFGMLAVGLAMEKSQAVTLLVGGITDIAGRFGPIAVLAALYVIGSVLTEVVTNNAVAIVLTPVAIALAQQMGVDPRPFVIAVMFAGSASFATPLGYQTNTFVYGAGNYRFSDFVRVGLPLNVLMGVLAVALIPLFWPF